MYSLMSSVAKLSLLLIIPYNTRNLFIKFFEIVVQIPFGMSKIGYNRIFCPVFEELSCKMHILHDNVEQI